MKKTNEDIMDNLIGKSDDIQFKLTTLKWRDLTTVKCNLNTVILRNFI